MSLSSFAMTSEELNWSDRIRLVIGSTSTGGDTYQVSSMVARYLESELNKNIKVDAVGATEAFKLLKRQSDGSTIMIFHDQSYLGYLYQRKGYPDIFSQFKLGPTFASNPGNAYLVEKSSDFKSLADVSQALKSGQSVKVAIQPGGVSEIGFSALKHSLSVQLSPQELGNLIAVNTGSQADKNQLLFDKQVQMIHGSVQSNEAFTQLPAEDQKAMSFIWLTANRETVLKLNASGYGQTKRDDLLIYTNPMAGVIQEKDRYFNFDKEYFFLYHKNTDPNIIRAIDQALENIFKSGEIKKTLLSSFFAPNFRSSKESEQYLKSKYQQMKDTVLSIRQTESAQLNQHGWQLDFESSHLFFPKIIFYALVLMALVMFWQHHSEILKSFKSLNDNIKLANYSKVLLFIVLIILYFSSMNAIGSLYPNYGLGFLVSSIPMMFLFSILMHEDLKLKKCFPLLLMSVVMPGLVWYLMGQVLEISLP